MKFNNLKITALAGIAAAAALAAPSAMALTYNPDDLFLGFRQLGNTSQDFIINLGSAATFRDATSPFTLTLANFDSQLVTLFGSDWRNAAPANGVVQWSLAGTTGAGPVGADPFDVIYISKAAASANPADSDRPSSGANQAGPSNNIIAMKNYYSLAATPDGTVTNSEIGNPGNSNSWSVRASIGFNSGNLDPIENSTNGFGLELFRVLEGSPSTTTPSYEGRLALGGGNNLVFTPAAVPEPSSAILASLAAAGLLGCRRNRKAISA